MDEIDHRISSLRAALSDASLSDEVLVQRFVSFGTPYVFSSDEALYHELRKEIADWFGIHPNDVLMVGSAKLGFSMSPRKLWTKIQDDSDIDMAIVCPPLFERVWRDLLGFNIDLLDRSEEDQKKYLAFLEYFFKGWIRPDLLPLFFRRSGWYDFFDGISYKKYDKRKVRGALYRDHYYFERYHQANVRRLRTFAK